MEYTTLEPLGVEVSKLCLGTSRFGVEDGDIDDSDIRLAETPREQVHEILDEAYERGINFIDTANHYGEPPGRSEELIGEWLESYDREDLVIASKVRLDMEDGPNKGGLSRKHIRAQIEESLERLGTDYLDIYYLHRPDEQTPLERTLATLNDLVREGRVHAIGLSNYPAWKIVKAYWICDKNGWETPSVIQPPFNAIERPEEILDVCTDLGLAVCGYRALMAGFLTGKYSRNSEAPEGSRGDLNPDFVEWFDENEWKVLDEVREIADEIEATPSQVALRWLIDQDEFTSVPIFGSLETEQLNENIDAVEISLSSEQHDRITDALEEDEKEVT